MKIANQYRVGILLAVALYLTAQTTDLPIKPGLWETSVKGNMTGPAAVPGRYCFAAGTTLAAYMTATNKGVPGAQCSISHKVQTGHGIAFDTACKSQNMSSSGHLDFQLPDAEHFTGSSHVVVTGAGQGKPMNMVIDKEFTAKFVSADCGSVKPLVLNSPPAK